VSPRLVETSSWFRRRSANLCLVMGGRLLVGLDILVLGIVLTGVGTPGDCDDIDVGVEVRLKAPGDSERRVDEPLS